MFERFSLVEFFKISGERKMPRLKVPEIKIGIGTHQIKEVETYITGFIGLTPKGPVNNPVLIQNYAEFEEHFGGFWELGQLAYSVQGFFQNGGIKCYIVRINESEEISDLTDAHFIGDEEAKSGLFAFDGIDSLNLLAIPDAKGSLAVMKAGLSYCELKRNCFFIADMPLGKTPSEVVAFMEECAYASSYGAIYYPSLYVQDPLTDDPKLVYPSGHIAGSYIKNDLERGVWKAPAGQNRKLIDVLDLELELGTADQEILNPIGVNLIRKFANIGIVLWGGRTLLPTSEYMYINVRRFINFIEKSIRDGTQWVVFEPNDEPLWAKIRAIITDFLTANWRNGALQGAKPQEAFFVKCDRENNPQVIVDEGKLNIDIGLAILKPAEFTRLNITHRTP
jgi:phage tail sheath protein FI